MKRVLGTILVATALAGVAGGAEAGPTLNINGVIIPVGIVAGGNQIDSAVLFETPVFAAGDLDQGVGRVTSINDAFGNEVWHSGQNGVELAYAFTFLASSVVAPTGAPGCVPGPGCTNGSATFSSGGVQFYTLPAGTPINGLGSIGADIAAVTTGTLFASTTAPTENAGGDVLVSTIPAGSSLAAFAGGTGQGFLDVTGGPAAGAFSTGTFFNPFDTLSLNPGFSDMSFTSDFTVGAGGDFGISGSATLKANTVAEPVSLGILGIGMMALGAIRRRKH